MKTLLAFATGLVAGAALYHLQRPNKMELNCELKANGPDLRAALSLADYRLGRTK